MSLSHQVIVIDKYLAKPENKLCADCKRPSPSWASLNLGVFVCIKCSGCHREIGVQVTKIKSTNLDLWPPAILVNFGKINNQIANNYWEQKLPGDFDFEKIKKDDYRLQDFIRDKYERKRYVDIKKIDPMTLIIKGYDISKDEVPKSNGSTTWEDDEDQKAPVYVKAKPGPNFNINSIKGEKQPIVQDNALHSTNNDNGVLIDFENVTSVNMVNNAPRVSQSSNGTNDKKTSGFTFIKKTNTIPKENTTIATKKIESNLDHFSQLSSVSSNNENLLDLFSVQSQPPKAVQDLTNSLMKVYNTSDPNSKQKETIPIMNYPPTNYDYYPINRNINQPYTYIPQYPKTQPYGVYNQPVNNPYYIERPNPIAQPFTLDLYNTGKPEKIKQEQPPTFTYNSNYTDSLNPKKNNDPFKNLVSFN